MLRVRIARLEDVSSSRDGSSPSWLGESERGRWKRLNPHAQAAFAASRALLRQLLEAATGVPAREWTVSAAPGCAPRASAPGAAADGVRASLSHRLGWVAAAVSDAAVGIDMECARPSRSDADERAALMLAPDELAAWKALAPAARESALLTCWTAKEAWFKAAPAQDAAWDFRRLAARACAPERANVRAWAAPPLHVAVCCSDPFALAQVDCAGLDPAARTSTFWCVGQA
jgi:phosphopantetheinyl transferase